MARPCYTKAKHTLRQQAWCGYATKGHQTCMLRGAYCVLATLHRVAEPSLELKMFDSYFQPVDEDDWLEVLDMEGFMFFDLGNYFQV